jgi:hypothetical protein
MAILVGTALWFARVLPYVAPPKNDVPAPQEVVMEGVPTRTEVPTKSLAYTCTGVDAMRFSCYKEYYRDLTERKGARVAFDDLKKEYAAIAYVRSQCHPLTHVIGRVAGEKAASVADAFVGGDSFCWSGYYHGVMESVVAKVGLENVPKQLDAICAKIPGREHYSFDYYNCVHGLGHGLMEVSQDELFDSLALCDHLVGRWEQESCWGGVFMESIIADATGRPMKYLKPSDPIYPCNAVDEKYKERCYMMQTSYMMKTTGSNFEKIFAICRTADANYRATCYQSAGRDASGSTTSDPERTKNICLLGANAEEQGNCVTGAAKDFVSYHHSDIQAKVFCEMLPAGLAKDCLSTVATYYVSFK